MKTNSNRGYIDGFTLALVGFAAFVVFIIVGAFLSAVGFPGGINSTYSEGSRMVIVNKLSYKGLVFKSYEAEGIMIGLRQSQDGNGSETVSANVFSFNVDPDAVEKVKAAMNTGKTVEVVYREWFITPFSISGSHVVYDVKPVK